MTTVRAKGRAFDWHLLSPAELLAAAEVLTCEQVAYVLDLVHTRGKVAGELDPGLVRKLIDSGKLRLVDPDQEWRHWRVASAEVRRYRDGERPRVTRLRRSTELAS